jgi:hypothetical protein
MAKQAASGVILFFMFIAPGYAQIPDGGQAIAARYAAWAEERIALGRWSEAELALERAGDFADLSSDISYLSALCRFHLDRPRRSVLEKLRGALETDAWDHHSPQDARMLEARVLVEIRSYEEALASLSQVQESLAASELRLRALRGLGNGAGFRAEAGRALERYSRESLPAALILDYEKGRLPGDEDRRLVNVILRRLPILLEQDPELAYRAAPFIRDTGEARRLVAAGRAAGRPSQASLVPALNLGLVSEEQVIEEFFSPPPSGGDEWKTSYELLRELWSLLRSREARGVFLRNLSALNGVITEDGDGDGIAETLTRYGSGEPVWYRHDADQDGVPDLELSFVLGAPGNARLAMLPDSAREEALRIYWEQYPAVLMAEAGDTRFFPAPLEYNYAPVKLEPLAGDGSPLYPRRDALVPRVSWRSLVSFAVRIERPGKSVAGSVEYIDLSGGIPLRVRETAGERLIGETEFRLGQPFLQRLDLDMDGRIETLRRFRRVPGISEREEALDFTGELESSESDWDGDGLFEYGERYYQNGEVERSWDLDGDGQRERRETGVY